MNKIGFFQALWGVCCGTRIFVVLRTHSLPRTLWHLFALSFLCAAVVTLCEARRLDREWKPCRTEFGAVFGSGLTFSARGIVPEKNPGVPGFVGLPGDGGLIYAGAGDAVAFPEYFLKRARYFTVWSDLYFAAAVRLDGEKWQVRVVSPDQSFSVKTLSTSDLSAYFLGEAKRFRANPTPWRLTNTRVSTSDLFSLIRGLTVAGLFISELIGILVLALLCTVMFTLVSKLTGALALRRFTGREYWKVGIYAGFPGMLIGSAVEALALPYLSYGIVYSMALVIYWLPASLACVRSMPPPEGGSPEA